MVNASTVFSNVQQRVLHIALVGNPNCGKTALFNRLTGAKQKVANYAGVTVERKEGQFSGPSGQVYNVIDLPGTYSLNAITPDESVTRDVLLGTLEGEQIPDVLVLVVDATNLMLNLRLVLEVKRLNIPMLCVVNMIDIARQRGLEINFSQLQQELGIPVVEAVAIQAAGANAFIERLEVLASELPIQEASKALTEWKSDTPEALESTQQQVRKILQKVIQQPGEVHKLSDTIDSVVLHPILGYVLLAVILFLVFQAVFSWSEAPKEMIEAGFKALSVAIQHTMPDGILRSLLIDGIIAGVGSVIVFLPQILILFFFILVLENSGYLPRAAFLLDRLMGVVGLSGRAFIPLLSSFACAIPGIMATRTIQNPRDRFITIMIAPLMTCSARLPVYALMIGAFIPNQQIGFFNLQGLVLFGLYMAGIVSAMLVAYILKYALGNKEYQPLMLELPQYHLPHLRSLALGLWERASIFVTRVGTTILAIMIILWFLSTFPSPPEHATGAAIHYSFAGKLGHLLEFLFKPIGFNWQISIALIPGMAAREVAVGALATVYALSESGDQLNTTLSSVIASTWGLPTGLSLLAWYIFAPQCISTLLTVKQETNSWKAPIGMAFYMFALAYLASWAVYRISSLMLLGGR